MSSFPSESEGEFSSGVRVGLTLVVVIAFFSAISVIGVVALVLRTVSLSKKNGSKYRPFSHPIGVQFLSLLFFDLIQSLGSILHIPWIHNAHVLDPSFVCTLQGVLKQVGDVGVALTTSTIAIHTFLVLAIKMEVRPIHAQLVVSSTYFAVALVVTIGFAMGARHNLPSIYGDTGYWCWITDDFSEERIVLEYMWLWLAAAISLLCYGGMALIIRGNMVIDKQRGIQFRRRRMVDTVTHPHHSIVWQMLFYPAVYIATIIPITVTRFIAFGGGEVPYPATFFASCLFSASGLLNSALFAYTRPSLSFHGVSTKTQESSSFSDTLQPSSINKSHLSA